MMPREQQHDSNLVNPNIGAIYEGEAIDDLDCTPCFHLRHILPATAWWFSQYHDYMV